jgi:transcription antitermination protein NusB
MASRYDQREIVIQALFESDFNDTLDTTNVEAVLKRDALEFLLLESVPEFAQTLASGVVLKREVIDQIIEKAAPEWPMHKISIIDRALLRLGIFELLFGSELNIPPKVAINEAIELAKAFGGDTSRKFVNGVLGGIYKEMAPADSGEVGKSGEIQKEKKRVETIQMAGAIVYRRNEDKLEIAMVRDMFKHWTLPKGTISEGETKEACAMRKVKEEINLEIKIEKNIKENEYTADSKQGLITKKHVSYFIARAITESIQTEPTNTGILEAKWALVSDLDNLKIYKDIRDMIQAEIKNI